MTGKEGWLFDLATWRSECPEESFESFLQQCKATLFDNVSTLRTEQLRRSLSYYETERDSLLRGFPHLASLGQLEPSEPEDQDFRICEMVLPILRMELTRRNDAPPPEAEPASPQNSTPPRIAHASIELHGASLHTAIETRQQPITTKKRQYLLKKYRSEIKRAILIQLTTKPDASDLEVCRGLDADGAVEMPKQWQEGDRLWQRAYRGKSRRKIENYITKVRRDLRAQGLLSPR